MSSPPVTPYKSRILNAINRTFLKWGDFGQISLNKLKIMAQWGIEILLYPLYLGIQTTRLALKQLLNSSPPILPQEIEKPLDKILTEIKPQVSREIQGIATTLTTKKLVLVSQENQLLALKNSQQEKQLDNWIKWELANYYYQQKLMTLNKSSRYLTSIKTDNPHGLLPFKTFWQMMAWEQKSTLAITLNIFGELSLIEHSHHYGLTPHLNNGIVFNPQNYLVLHNFLREIDDKIAILEENAKTINLLNFTHNIAKKIPQQIANFRLNNDPHNPFTIQAIIIAALTYFFGQKSPAQTRENNSSSSQLNSSNEPDFNQIFPSQELGTFNHQEPEELSNQNPPQTPSENQDPYLEISATTVGYEKHFLEKVLTWLDGIIVSVEELLINIFNWFKRKN